ncbi:MAG: hypothetical protein U9O87_10745 [Verrucomicrobiota bacterium]|nr:hypothetical protein [Verrucomicrobiota bacterium]
MTNRERVLAILNYQSYDRLPIVHFGLWNETLDIWVKEGHISAKEAEGHSGGNPPPTAMKRLGFDMGWVEEGCGADNGFRPSFKTEVIEELPDGSKKVRNGDGVIILQMPNAGSIPAEIDHLLKDRASWEEHYLPRLQFCEDRIDYEHLEKLKGQETGRENPLSIDCGSMIGTIRNWLGVEGLSYLWADDPDLFDEIINTYFELIYKGLKKMLATGIKCDFGAYWEDICFKTGPLVTPSVFNEKCGPHYREISNLLKKHDIQMSFLDCDGLIDSLIPT